MYQLFYNENFIEAVNDYYYLINKNYPSRMILKLVSDRYNLNHDQRTIIYRGVFKKEEIENRKKRLTVNLENSIIWIDGYNVLFPVTHYLTGRPLFVSLDNMVRDVGRWSEKELIYDFFEKSSVLLIEYLKNANVKEIHVCIDDTPKYGLLHKNCIENLLLKLNKNNSCILNKTADKILEKIINGIIATSDTEILSKNNLQIVDLPKLILKHFYEANFVNLSIFLRN